MASPYEGLQPPPPSAGSCSYPSPYEAFYPPQSSANRFYRNEARDLYNTVLGIGEPAQPPLPSHQRTTSPPKPFIPGMLRSLSSSSSSSSSSSCSDGLKYTTLVDSTFENATHTTRVPAALDRSTSEWPPFTDTGSTGSTTGIQLPRPATASAYTLGRLPTMSRSASISGHMPPLHSRAPSPGNLTSTGMARSQSDRGPSPHHRRGPSLSPAALPPFANRSGSSGPPLLQRRTSHFGAYSSVSQSTSISRFSGTEVPLATITNHMDGILAERHNRLMQEAHAKSLVDKERSERRKALEAQMAMGIVSQMRRGGRSATAGPSHSSKTSAFNGHDLYEASSPEEEEDSGSEEENAEASMESFVTRSGRPSRAYNLAEKDSPPEPTRRSSGNATRTDTTNRSTQGTAKKKLKTANTQPSTSNPVQDNVASSSRGGASASSAPGSSTIQARDIFPRRLHPRGRDASQPPAPLPGEPSYMQPRTQPPKFTGDLYTPATVRAGKSSGKGSAAGGIGTKEGWCGLCPPADSPEHRNSHQSVGGWLNLRNSSYRYHLVRAHGISPKTFLPFQEPVETVQRDPERELRVGPGTELRGRCHQCNTWIVFGRDEATNFYVHASKCHRENPHAHLFAHAANNGAPLNSNLANMVNNSSLSNTSSAAAQGSLDGSFHASESIEETSKSLASTSGHNIIDEIDLPSRAVRKARGLTAADFLPPVTASGTSTTTAASSTGVGSNRNQGASTSRAATAGRSKSRTSKRKRISKKRKTTLRQGNDDTDEDDHQDGRDDDDTTAEAAAEGDDIFAHMSRYGRVRKMRDTKMTE